MMDDLPVRTLLGSDDVDRLTGVIHALLTEVAALSERVHALEAARDGAVEDALARQESARRLGEITERVLHPLLAS